MLGHMLEQDENTILVENKGIQATLSGVPAGIIVDLYKKYNGSDDDFTAAMFEAMIVASIEMDRLPEDDKWLQHLLLQVRLGLVTLPEWVDDIAECSDVELEYFYKRYFYVTSEMIQQIGLLTGNVEEEISALMEQAASKLD